MKAILPIYHARTGRNVEFFIVEIYVGNSTHIERRNEVHLIRYEEVHEKYLTPTEKLSSICNCTAPDKWTITGECTSSEKRTISEN